MHFRSRYDEVSRAQVAAACLVMCTAEEDRAVQGDRVDANINNIVARFKRTGVAPAASLRPIFGDFSGEYDLQTVFEAARAAREAFEELPADVRDRFANDPVRLQRFLSDGRNREEAERLGLLRPVPDKGSSVASERGTAVEATSGDPKGSSSAPGDSGAVS